MYLFGIPEAILVIFVILIPLFVLILISYSIVKLLLHRNKTKQPVQDFFQFEENNMNKKK